MYYFYHKEIDDALKEKLHQAVDESNVNEIYKLLSSAEPIFLGQLEYGWKFVWEPHEFKYFRPNTNSFLSWLKTADYITDENGIKMSVNQFLNSITNSIYDNNLYDIQKFVTENPDQEYLYKPMFNDLCKNYSLTHNVSVNLYNEFYIGEFLFRINLEPM